MLKPTSNCPKHVWDAYHKDPRPWSANKKPSLIKLVKPAQVVYSKPESKQKEK